MSKLVEEQPHRFPDHWHSPFLVAPSHSLRAEGHPGRPAACPALLHTAPRHTLRQSAARLQNRLFAAGRGEIVIHWTLENGAVLPAVSPQRAVDLILVDIPVGGIGRRTLINIFRNPVSAGSSTRSRLSDVVRHGFTLIELLAVIVIISTLAALLPALLRYFK